MSPSPFVLSFFGSLWLLSLTACRTPPVHTDGELLLSPVQVKDIGNEGPARALAWFGIALHREITGDPAGALEAYRHAIEEDPGNDALYLTTTRRLIQSGRPEDAFLMLDTLLERSPRNIQALRWKARLHQQKENLEEALTAYREALELKPEEETFYLEAIQTAVQNEQPDLALTFARQGARHASSAIRITQLYLRLLDAAKQNAADLQTLADLEDEKRLELDNARRRYPQESSFLYLKAEQAFGDDTPNLAFQQYSRIDSLTDNQDEERARILVHAIRMLGGGRKGARAFRDLAEERDGDALALYLQGLLWELQGSEPKALRAYTAAAQQAPEDAPTLRKLAVLQYQQGNPRRAMALLDKVLTLEPDNPEMILLAGRIALASEQFPRAADLLKQRIQLQKQGHDLEDAPAVHAQLAIALWETGENPERIIDLLETAAQSPGNLELVWRQRYRTIFRIREQDAQKSEHLEKELLTVFEDLCDRLPHAPEPPWLTASVHSMRGDYKNALEFLEEVEFRAGLTENPEDWLGTEYWFDVAAALERTGELERSEELFLDILEKDPDHHSSLNYIAYMWAEQGVNLDRAYQFVQRALRLDPENASYIDTLGWVYYQQGEFEKAYRELLRSSELMPEEPVIAEHLGDVLMKLDRPVEARGYYRIALALDPGDRLDIVLESLQAAEDAVAEQTVNSPPSHGDIL
jgi:tetratricopeptide (TPR) repeat protein